MRQYCSECGWGRVARCRFFALGLLLALWRNRTGKRPRHGFGRLTAEQTGDKMVEGLAIGLVGGFGAGLVVAVAVIKFYLRLTNQQVLLRIFR